MLVDDFRRMAIEEHLLIFRLQKDVIMEDQSMVADM
jgi:hypothetical protein